MSVEGRWKLECNLRGFQAGGAAGHGKQNVSCCAAHTMQMCALRIFLLYLPIGYWHLLMHGCKDPFEHSKESWCFSVGPLSEQAKCVPRAGMGIGHRDRPQGAHAHHFLRPHGLCPFQRCRGGCAPPLTNPLPYAKSGPRRCTVF